MGLPLMVFHRLWKTDPFEFCNCDLRLQVATMGFGGCQLWAPAGLSLFHLWVHISGSGLWTMTGILQHILAILMTSAIFLMGSHVWAEVLTWGPLGKLYDLLNKHKLNLDNLLSVFMHLSFFSFPLRSEALGHSRNLGMLKLSVGMHFNLPKLFWKPQW